MTVDVWQRSCLISTRLMARSFSAVFFAVLRVNFPELDFTSSITLFYLILEKRKNYSGLCFCNQTPKGAKYGEDRVLCSE